MPAIDFPNNPSLNQEFTSGNRTWIWNGVAWEAYGTYIGATGPTGPTGSAAAITAAAPVVYNNSTQEISLNYGLGLTTAGNDLAVSVSGPVVISDGAVTLNTSAPVTVTNNALTVATSAPLTTANNALTVSVGAGLTTTGANALAVNNGTGITLTNNLVNIDNTVVTLTGTQLVSNKEFVAPREQVVINTASALTTSTAINVAAGAVVVYTTTPSANAAITLSLGASGSLGSMANVLPNTGDSITIAVLNPSGASFATFINVIQIDGTATNVTTQWQLGVVPTQATTALSSTDSYMFTVINTNTATSPKTYRVYASRTRYA